MKLRWLPNAITISRMVMALPLLWLLMIDDYRSALWLALVAGLSDALDGFIAKTFDWRSALGGILDPIADKLLLSVCFFGLWWSLHLPTWLVALVFARDLVIVVGALAWWRLMGTFKPAPSLLSKMNTTLQIGLVAVVLAHLALWRVPLVFLQSLLLATALLTLLSGLDYVIRYGSRAWRALGSRQ
ncbi:MAG TPA: CDP-alcohol phosphatidyltransferase family protein [Arenimonas sp.]|uniref:CDP-alcohol phosphatidyltransferase family protein n=1 Tax=Arenimonas sp. TaxID=1872635 RepID=UPI002C8A53EC|nr:CDP-alcohol phosphatidyltransferase family protein [Arenimonas sp.]HMB56857.1 CDP-alcohol phosphatidyltransferase family protein [Arenimonas sp.]